MSALAILTAARVRIADPAAYTADCLALTATGRPTMPERPNARRWCADGALSAEAARSDRAANHARAAHAALCAAAGDLHGQPLVEVERRYGHAGALAAYDRAIALAAAGEAR